MASIFTGIYPTSHGINSGSFDPKTKKISQPILGDKFTTIAEALKEQGYTTIGVPSNRHLASSLGFKQGFDHYLPKAPWMESEAVNAKVRQQMKAAYGDNWRTEWKKSKTFLWIHYFDPHIPYKAHDRMADFAPDYEANKAVYPVDLMTPAMEKYAKTPEANADHVRAMYAQEVRFLDDKFKVIANDLGLMDPDVALIITSDHGEELLDHGNVSHGKTLYNEVVNIPFLFRWKGGGQKARGVSQPVSLLDILPTLIDVGGGAIPDNVQGVSLLSALRGENPAESRGLLFELRPRGFGGVKYRMVGFTDGRYKLVRSRKPGEMAPSLFDLKADPLEKTDIITANPEIAARLEAAMSKMLSDLPSPDDVKQHESDDSKLIEELEALGYLGD
jgi:arylsulfatase A-like enzyme